MSIYKRLNAIESVSYKYEWSEIEKESYKIDEINEWIEEEFDKGTSLPKIISTLKSCRMHLKDDSVIDEMIEYVEE